MINNYLNKSTYKRVFSLIIIFIIFKSIGFISPLGLQEVINSNEIFGIFEYTLNIGQIITGLFVFGLVGTYGYFIIKNNENELKPLFHLHFLVIGSVIFLFAVFQPKLIGNIYFDSVVLGAAFANQIIISAILKSENQNNLSVIVDTGVYSIMFLFFLLCYSGVVEFSQVLWQLLLLLYLFITTFFYHFKRIKGIKKLKIKHYKKIYKFGVLILISAPLLVLLTSSSRIYIEHFLDYSYVGIYSFYFRLSTIILVIYRVFGILMFNKFFLEDYKKLDLYFSLIIIIIFIINFFVIIVLPFILDGRFNKWDSLGEDYSNLLLLCGIQVSLWINSALLEPIIQRENQIKSYILILLLLLFSLIGALFLYDKIFITTIYSIIIINSILIYVFFIAQYILLSKKNIFFNKTLIVNIGLGFLYAIILITL